MTDPVSAFQPAIDALEKDFTDLERKANGLLQSINLLREKAGLPPRPGGWLSGTGQESGGTPGGTPIALHSDTFTGKKLGAAVREYLEMRKRSGVDAPATSREIFDALKQGGFSSGAKDDATALVVLRTLLRKNTTTFAKLSNGKYGLRAWYPNLKAPKEAAAEDADDPDADILGGDDDSATSKNAAA
ncbi:MAG TPA: hypothetical protein VHX86_00270 [Tepidisphaeraceae bacterium]|jgi:hypothetical protein|nr:hypothetical protein [Tepidisphaeraceae bacterium]